MRVLGALVLLLFGSALPAVAAPILAWDAVTTDASGTPLVAGLEVMSYNVYRCGTGMGGACAAPDRLLVGIIAAPAVQIDLAGQSFPQVYVVTAVNRAGESLDSAKFKVTPAAEPRNLRLP